MEEENEYNKAIYNILDAEEAYEEHKFRYGAIHDSLMAAMVSVNKARKQKEKMENAYKALVADRDRFRDKVAEYEKGGD